MAANKKFYISDDDDMSTAELIGKLINAGGFRKTLFHNFSISADNCYDSRRPKSSLSRLTESLQVDPSNAKKLLGWTPPHTVDSSLLKVFEKEKSACNE